MSPLQVEHIISKAEEDHAADGKQRTYQLHKLIMRETLTLLSHKAAEERHGDEEEKDDEENRATDHALRFGHFLFCGFVQILAIQPGSYEVLLEGWDELECCHAAQNRHAAADDEGKDRDWRHFWKLLFTVMNL